MQKKNKKKKNIVHPLRFLCFQTSESPSLKFEDRKGTENFGLFTT